MPPALPPPPLVLQPPPLLSSPLSLLVPNPLPENKHRRIVFGGVLFSVYLLQAGCYQATTMSDKPKILYCRCAYAQVVPQGIKDGVLARLCESGTSFESVADLCEMAAHRDPRLTALASSGPLRIAACYPRVVKGLFQQAGSPLPEESTEIYNMRTDTAEDIATQILRTP
jgi:hypothetical protein